MAIYFSVGRRGFYNTEAGVPIPEDAIEITEDQYKNFLFAMNTQNKILALDENGQLTLKPRKNDPISWEMIRQKRNRILSQSDYTQMPDWPGDKTSWKKYRQELRDIPQNFADTDKVVWPKAPSA